MYPHQIPMAQPVQSNNMSGGYGAGFGGGGPGNGGGSPGNGGGGPGYGGGYGGGQGGGQGDVTIAVRHPPPPVLHFNSAYV